MIHEDAKKKEENGQCQALVMEGAQLKNSGKMNARKQGLTRVQRKSVLQPATRASCS